MDNRIQNGFWRHAAARKLAALCARPGLLVPLLLAICLQAAWMGVRLAAAAAPNELTPTQLPATPGTASGGAGRMTAAQCMACHVPEPVLSHPVGVKPSMQMAAGFPLVEGQMNCITCHSDSIAQHSAAKAGSNALLRGTMAARAGGTGGAAFCAECHAGSTVSRESQHPTAIARAHGGWIKGGPAVHAAISAGDNGVKSCLACHDGTVASDAFGGMNRTAAAALGKTVGGSNHPVGMAYPNAGAVKGDVRLVPAGRVDHRVLLSGGQVTCVSCHSLYSGEAKLLVMRNDGSALCIACHAN